MADKANKEEAKNRLEPLSEMFQRGSLMYAVLKDLLKDQTTGKNIVWATDTYKEYGAYYSPERQMFPDFNLNLIYDKILLPRVQKPKASQKDRTKKRAEVFTPSWVCCLMNNYCDDEYFGRENVFNILDRDTRTWTRTEEKIVFPEVSKYGKTPWQMYVDDRRIEITCGEAPYLVSRYDTTTGDPIPIDNRIGIVDRKFRVINENAKDKNEWMDWARRAYESSYGYEYQGDNLFFARVNMVQTFIDYYEARFGEKPSVSEVRTIARIVSWNVWQMDGLKDIVPHGIPEDNFYQESLLEEEKKASDGLVYAKVRDWRKNKDKVMEFRETKKERR